MPNTVQPATRQPAPTPFAGSHAHAQTPKPSPPGHSDHSAFVKPHPHLVYGGPSVGDSYRAVSAALDALTRAEKAATDTDKELITYLQDTGVGLTAAEKAHLIKEYRKDPAHQPKYDAVNRASRHAANELSTHLRGLALGANADPEMKKTFTEAITRLAKSENAKVVLDIIAETKNEPNGPVAKALRAIPDFNAKVLEPAIASTASALLAEKGDPKKALDALKGPLGDALKFGYGPYEANALMKDSLGLLDEIATGKLDPAKYDRVARMLDGAAHAKGPVAGGLRALAVVNVLFSASQGLDAANDGKTATAIGSFCKATQGGADLLCLATKSLGEASRVFKATKVLARFAPGLGAIASGISMADRFSKPMDGGQVFGAYGDMIGVLGGVMECVPPLAPIGALVSGVGCVFSLTGDAISAAIQDSEYRGRKTAMLRRAGVPEPLCSAYGNCDGNQLTELSTHRGFTTKQIRALVTTYPNLLPRGDRHGVSYGQLGALMDLKKKYHLTSTEFLGLLDRACPQHTPQQLAAWSMDLMNITNGWVSGTDQSIWEPRNLLWQMHNRGRWSDPAAALNVAAYLEPFKGRFSQR